jgi:hypothetical protein
MMEAAHTSETLVDIQLRTRQCIPEDSELHTRRRENLKSHKRRTSILSSGSEATIPANKLPQTYALAHAAIGIGNLFRIY